MSFAETYFSFYANSFRICNQGDSQHKQAIKYFVFLKKHERLNLFRKRTFAQILASFFEKELITLVEYYEN